MNLPPPNVEQIYNRYKDLSQNTGGEQRGEALDTDHYRPAECHHSHYHNPAKIHSSSCSTNDTHIKLTIICMPKV